MNPFLRLSSRRDLAVACENLSKYYPIVMKFSGHLPCHKETSAIDFGHDWSNLLAGCGPKVGHNELLC